MFFKILLKKNFFMTKFETKDLFIMNMNKNGIYKTKKILFLRLISRFNIFIIIILIQYAGKIKARIRITLNSNINC